MTARTYELRTYGCQMNAHDSERLAGLLEDAGYVRAGEDDGADVVVFNTCAVRENADNRLYGNLGHLAPVKARTPGMQIAVGGCLAQKDRREITRRAELAGAPEGMVTSLGCLDQYMTWRNAGAWQDPSGFIGYSTRNRSGSNLPEGRRNAH